MKLDQRGRSGEVDYAVRDASIRYLETRIGAYEAVCGHHDRMPTTRYTVLTDADLAHFGEA